MDARERLASAARSLKPLQQGHLDSLCGLYATINAIQLALHPARRLKRSELVQLFDAGLDGLRSVRSTHSALILGMHEPVWRAVSAAVIARANAITGRKLELVRVSLTPDTDGFALTRHIRHNVSRGRPVLLCVEGRLNHWTVVARFSKTRLTLFDSSHHAWLLVRSIGVGGGDLAKPYTVPPYGVVALHGPEP